MAIKPDEVFIEKNAVNETVVKHWEACIDKILMQKARPDRYVWIFLDSLPRFRMPDIDYVMVRIEIMRLYKEAGWEVKFQDDQRNGPCLQISLPADSKWSHEPVK